MLLNIVAIVELIGIYIVVVATVLAPFVKTVMRYYDIVFLSFMAYTVTLAVILQVSIVKERKKLERRLNKRNNLKSIK